MKHELRIAPPYFQAIADGHKNFEIRKNDRGFQKGDEVTLVEYDEDKGTGFKYGRRIDAEIGYVTGYEQKEGYVVFSLKKILAAQDA